MWQHSVVHQLYKYEIEGFLHWGFNYWFKQLSLGVVNPYYDTTEGNAFPSGEAFVVHPLDDDVVGFKTYPRNSKFILGTSE